MRPTPQGRSGRVRKMSPQKGLDPRTVHPVANRYADYVIPAHKLLLIQSINRETTDFGPSYSSRSPSSICSEFLQIS